MACPCQQQRPLATGLVGDEPATGTLVVSTLGWLLLGGVVGAAFWVTAQEIGLIRKGKH